MLALSGEDEVSLIVVEGPKTSSASFICLNIYSIVTCTLVERSFVSTSIERVATVETGTK